MPKNPAISIFGSNPSDWKGAMSPFNSTKFIADTIQSTDDVSKSSNLYSPGMMLHLSPGGKI